MDLILKIISGLLVLNIVIIVHEYGHYRSAVKAKVYAPVFAIGFGKTIWKFHQNKYTSFELKLIPFGGYVRLASSYEDSTEINVPSELKTLEEVSKLRQIWIIAAGAIYNFIFAICIFFILGIFSGHQEYARVVGFFDKSYNAHKVLKLNDELLSINGHKIERNDILSMYVKTTNKIQVKRYDKIKKKNEIINVTVKAKKDSSNRLLLGIGQSQAIKTNEFGVLAAIKHVYIRFTDLIDMQFRSIQMLFTGKAKLSDMSGPVGIIRVTGEVIVNNNLNIISKIAAFLDWLAVISIAIGFANLILFILPVVDGGRIFLIILSTILKKDLSNTKIVNYLMTLCIVLMLVYFVYITFIDVFRHM